MNCALHQSRHSGESRNPVFSRVSGCRIKSGMTENDIYGQTLIKERIFAPGSFGCFGQKEEYDGEAPEMQGSRH